MRATGLGITYYKYLESIDSLLVNTGGGCGLLPCSEVDGQVRNIICSLCYSTCTCVYIYTVHVYNY